jgi:hypothetical protein
MMIFDCERFWRDVISAERHQPALSPPDGLCFVERTLERDRAG